MTGCSSPYTMNYIVALFTFPRCSVESMPRTERKTGKRQKGISNVHVHGKVINILCAHNYTA